MESNEFIDPTIPSSQRTTAAANLRTAAAVGAKGQTRNSTVPGEHTQPDGGDENLSLPSSQRARSGSTPLARAMDELNQSKELVRATGGDDAAVIKAVAERIRQRVAAMPQGAATPMTDRQIDAMVDSCIKQVLDSQKKKVSAMTANVLKMSSTRAAMKMLIADKERIERDRAMMLARRYSRHLGGFPVAVRMSNPPSGRVPSLLSLTAKEFPRGLCF